MEYVSPNLPREIFGWHSPRLGIHMPIVRYGNWGKPLLLHPTAAADYLEYERFFLIKALEPHIFAGKVQVFCIDSINKHSWMNPHLPVREKCRLQALFSGYVEEEVVPHIRRCVQDPSARIAVSGASFGAFHAANAFFRRPDLFDTLLALSGFYDLGPDYLRGYSDADAYFNNPMWFVRNLEDPGVLDTIRRHSQIHLLTGQGQWEAPECTVRFSELLWSRGIWHNRDLWGHDMAHDWPTWRRMVDHYVGHRLGW